MGLGVGRARLDVPEPDQAGCGWVGPVDWVWFKVWLVGWNMMT